MTKNEDLYYVYASDNVRYGDSLKIERTISMKKDKTDISELICLPFEILVKRRNESVGLEDIFMARLIKGTENWEEQAAITRLLDMAVEYIKTPAVEHSSNEWQEDKLGYGWHIRSNAVYAMSYRIREETKRNRDTGTFDVVAWDLSWALRTQSPNSWPRHVGAKIAGQDRRFTDKSAMEKYLAGRIKAYSHLFTEISPPIPKEYAYYFKVNELLLPGYTIAGEDKIISEINEADRPKESVLERIAADKEAKKSPVTNNQANQMDKVKTSKGKDREEL